MKSKQRSLKEVLTKLKNKCITRKTEHKEIMLHCWKKYSKRAIRVSLTNSLLDLDISKIHWCRPRCFNMEYAWCVCRVAVTAVPIWKHEEVLRTCCFWNTNKLFKNQLIKTINE